MCKRKKRAFCLLSYSDTRARGVDLIRERERGSEGGTEGERERGRASERGEKGASEGGRERTDVAIVQGERDLYCRLSLPKTIRMVGAAHLLGFEL